MLEKIRTALNEGKMVKVNSCNMWLSEDRTLIRWVNYGSSANKNTDEELLFVLKEIAEYEDGQDVFINEGRDVYSIPTNLRRI